ncbi:MAG: MaoC family dehydratase N-terminal domain-containing protein [Candidatus Lambdaproteobacteria bacterium]|nr:MaoC family dehydratase N-terminal domain-containing protein [Candidatus Lambdaproteobacteria bacterium]
MTQDVRVTEAELDRQRRKLGQRMTIVEPPYLTEVTRDAIRHWAWATGDRNPLYLDEAYAARGPHGTLIAPPCMLYAFDRLSIGYRGGLPGVHAMFGGSWWRWRRPARLGERIHTEVTYKDLVELPSRFARRMFKQISLIRFRTDQGEQIAESDSWGMRTERVAARKTAKYERLERKPVTAEQLADVAGRYARERCRGAEPLTWEEVEVGSAIPEIVRGPYTATTAIAFEQAWGGLFIWAHGYWFEYLRAHPAAGLPNAYGVPEPPEAVHWDSALARSVGVPEAYDYGPERIAWMATLLTNWIGDRGFLAELYCEVRRFNLIGDITTCRAQVTAKEPGSDGTGRVRLDVQALDQRGETTLKGWAVVELPRR